MSWSDDDFEFDAPALDFSEEDEEDEACAPSKPEPAKVPKPKKSSKLKGKKLRDLKQQQKLQKQEELDAEMKRLRVKEREIRLKCGQNATQRDIANALADESAKRELTDLFGNAVCRDDDDEDDDEVDPAAAAFLHAEKSKGGTSLLEEAAQFNGPIEHALAVLKIIGVTEHEEFGAKLGDKMVEDNNIENAVALMCALAKGIKPLLSSKEFGELAKVANVLKNDKMIEEKLARGKKKKTNKKPKVQTIREDDLSMMGAGDYGGGDTYYDQYW